MHNPFASKVLRDLWGSKARTALVVLSIAVGVFAVGMMAASQAVMASNMDASFLAINPSSAQLTTSDLDDDAVRAVGNMREVAAVDARYQLIVRAKGGDGAWHDLQLFILPNFDHIAINTVVSESGAWPPPKRELLIERAALGMLGSNEGDTITIETASRKQRQARVAGVAHDLHQWPANFGVTAYGYATFDTLSWLGIDRAYNQIAIVAAQQPYDKDHAHAVATLVKDQLEKNGHTVHAINIRDPGKHNAYGLVQSLAMMLGIIGGVALALSGFLVVNTVSALLTQQLRQIGVLKTFGASTAQVVGLYLGLVACYGVLALALALPLGMAGARWFSGFVLTMFNFDLVSFSFPPGALALQVVVALVVPVLAALLPVLRGARVTVREAIGGAGEEPRAGRVLRIGLRSPQWVLALRNTFRRKGRLALTLVTLTLGGATFISVVSVRGALYLTLDHVLQYWKFDLDVAFQQPYSNAQALQAALAVPGVRSAEVWGSAGAFRVRPDGSEHDQITLSAPAAGSSLIVPIIQDGRWLIPEDENAVVVNSAFLLSEPDVKVGDTIDLKIGGKESDWRVIGIASGQIQGAGPIAYVNRDYLARLTDQMGRTSRIVIEAEAHDAATHAQVRQALEQQLKAQHLYVQTITASSDIRMSMASIFDIFVLSTVVTALLLAVVGGLGLMGLMSLNVMERQREIGVLRAVGADTAAMLGIVMAEGMAIGVVSWLLSVVVAIPLSWGFGYGVGAGFLSMPLAYNYSIEGAALWGVIAIALAALSSFLPAWHAASITVRDVLAYE